MEEAQSLSWPDAFVCLGILATICVLAYLVGKYKIF